MPFYVPFLLFIVVFLICITQQRHAPRSVKVTILSWVLLVLAGVSAWAWTAYIH